MISSGAARSIQPTSDGFLQTTTSHHRIAFTHIPSWFFGPQNMGYCAQSLEGPISIANKQAHTLE